MPEVIVLGAGVVGLASALYLLRAGHAVTVIDPLPPGSGASHGNAGMISADIVAPLSMPGMVRRVPTWLTDPLGPLSVRPRYVPRAAPWLLRWLSAGRTSRVLPISDALRSLHSASFGCWKELLGASDFEKLIRQSGQVFAWEDPAPAARGAVSLDQRLRERHGIRAEVLGPADLQRLFPGISPGVVRGLLLPGNGYVLNPGRLVRRMAEMLRAEGGRLLAERVLKLVPRAGGGWLVMTTTDNHWTDIAVVAAGAWSNALLTPLGLRLPMEAERGYHAVLRNASIDLPMPISVKGRGVALTPMEDGLRAAGTVEFAGLDAPPDERRAMQLAAHARQIFPDLRHDEPILWMGARPGMPDSLPVLGPAPGQPGLFLCCGHGHFGMTSGPPSGRLLAELIAGAPPSIDPQPFLPTRFFGAA